MFPFYKKIEIIEFSHNKLRALFTCHKLLDVSSFRIIIQYFNEGVQTKGFNATIKDPKMIADDFAEFQIENYEIGNNVDFVKIYVVHTDVLES